MKTQLALDEMYDCKTDPNKNENGDNLNETWGYITVDMTQQMDRSEQKGNGSQ